MKLQTKAIILLDIFIVAACICMGILGYRSANEGFDEALQMKARSNVISFQEIMDLRHPGNWQVKKDGGEVDAITAATISSRAALECIRDAITRFDQIKDELE